MNYLQKFLALNILLLALFSCTGKQKDFSPLPRPTHLLNKAQMAELLTQVHLLEAAVNLKNAQNQSLNKRDSLPYNDIFRKYNIDYAQFQENYKYYASTPKELETIYDEVITDLTRMQAVEERRK
jgi:hypothetical protein